MSKSSICAVDTFAYKLPSVNQMATQYPVNSTVVSEIQRKAINPDLKNCGRMAVCVGCEIGAFAQVLETSARVASKL